jgi:hypothetical protein
MACFLSVEGAATAIARPYISSEDAAFPSGAESSGPIYTPCANKCANAASTSAESATSAEQRGQLAGWLASMAQARRG